MPQGEHIALHAKRHGRRLDHEELLRKRAARAPHEAAARARRLIGYRGILHSEARRKEKIALKKKIRAHQERQTKDKVEQSKEVARPAYLLDREAVGRARLLSNELKQKRKTRAAAWAVPVPRVEPLADSAVFKVLKSGKRGRRAWKRKVTMATLQQQGHTRKPPKYERFIRPAALRYRLANVTHPELAVTHQLEILAVKKNPSSHLYTDLGVLTRGTVVEVNVAALGLVTASGKMVWGKYAQITNHPERDGCVNAVLLV